jgi:hypothetical protein
MSVRKLWRRLVDRADHFLFGHMAELVAPADPPRAHQPRWRCRVCGREWFGVP